MFVRLSAVRTWGPLLKAIEKVRLVAVKHETQPGTRLRGHFMTTQVLPLPEAVLSGAYGETIFSTKKVLHISFDVGTVV